MMNPTTSPPKSKKTKARDGSMLSMSTTKSMLI